MPRSSLDLLDLPFTFTQLPPLTADGFIREAKDRGARISQDQLEHLHRLRLLVPVFRVRRDTRAIAELALGDNEQRVWAWPVAHADPTSRHDLLEARDRGQLFDPSTERFIARQSLQRTVGEVTYLASEYLYSQHQLLHLPTVRAALPHLRYAGRAKRLVRLDVHRFYRDSWRATSEATAVVATVLSGLEPIYYPRVVRTVNLADEDFRRWDSWLRRLPLTATLKWLGIEAQWLKDTASNLLWRADGFDPLGDWLDVVRLADPSRWTRLKGQARNAIDFRIAAEVLLRYYEALARGRRARPLEKPQGRWRGELDGRLTARKSVDAVLTDFGLSPHPSLILVVEGPTEGFIFPRVMQMFGVRTDEDFIAIQEAEGVDRDLSPLISYAIAPRTEVEDNRYLRLVRPLARILVVLDPEGSKTTREQRENHRSAWVERMLRTLPPEHRTEAVRESLGRLVYVETWDRVGSSFEFAHFTDRQIALALARHDTRERQPTASQRTKLVAGARERRGNLKTVIGRKSKPALGPDLWPMLEQKIRLAQTRGTEERIPIVRMLDRATDLAREISRRNIVIPLHNARNP